VRADSGPEALRRLLDQDFAVILLDVRMPGMDGYETARIIRSRDKTRHTPIIFITAHTADDPIVLRAYKEGAADHMVKPFVPEILRSKVARFVELYQKSEHIRELERVAYESRLAEEKQQWELERLREELAQESQHSEVLSQRAENLSRLSNKLQEEIAERLRVEHELRDSERRFRELADSMPQIVWSSAPDGTVDYFNRRWFDYTGAPEGTGGADGWKPYVHPDDQGPSTERFAACVTSGQPFQMEMRLKGRTGAYRWHLARCVPVPDEAGTITRWYGTSTDIDEQKRTQVALEEADRHKDEFLAMLAHELRNPLAPILNGLHILKPLEEAGSLAAKTRAMMERQAEHLIRLVDDLVDVSRLVFGQIQLRPEPVTLEEVVNRALDTTRPLIDERQHVLTVTLPPQPVWLSADPVRLAQVLANLLSNAAKYTEPGGRITVTAEIEEVHNGDAPSVIVRIKDTGKGISTELLPRVFELFQQGQRTLDRSEGGLGIGLTLVRRLVELHSGRVRAASAGPGQGSEFTISLPLPTKPLAPLPPPATRPARPAMPCRILVVDDNDDGAHTLAMLLKLWGHDFRLAHDGPSAVKIADSFRPEVVLLDIGLPGMDGYEVARRLREEAGLKDVFLVAVTGYGQDDDRRRSRESGFDHHLVKPVDPEALEQLLAHFAAARGYEAAPL
jgi:two-component system CheB/CheR fusion protein